MKLQLFIVGLIFMIGCSSSKNINLRDDGFLDVTSLGISTSTSKDQTEKIQNIFLKYRKQGKFFFPSGKYHVSQLHIYPGIQIKGEDETWFIKRPNQAKFNRMFNTIKYMHEGRNDSEEIVFDNINIDGNYKNQGPYVNYQLEHQAMIFLAANKKFPGRLKAHISNCHFKDGVGDAICVFNNVDAKIYNCSAENVFRGAITIGGGHTIVDAANLIAKGDVHKTGVDIEVDGIGYGKTKKVDVVFKDMNLEGDFDIALSDNSTFYGENITCLGPPFNLYAVESRLHLNKSKIHTSPLANCKVMFPYDVFIENTDFIISDSDDKDKLGAMLVYWNTSYAQRDNQKLRLENCRFISKVDDASKKVIGIKTNADDYINNNLLDLENVTFEGDFDHNVFMQQGGQIKMRDVSLNGQRSVYLGSVVGKSKYRYKADIKNLKPAKKGEGIIEYTENEANEITIDKNTESQMKSSVKRPTKTIIKRSN